MAASPASSASVSLTYYGHCAFLWQTPGGVRVLIDPYRNRHDRYWFTRHFPDVPCDLALITHAHFDHDATPELAESVSILRMPGDFHYRDVHVRGILDQHSGRFSRGMANVMFRLETAGLRFLHIGDNCVEWPDTVRQDVGEIDILMVTVDDSCHLLTYPEVDTLIDMVRPRVVIPMHYQIPGLMSEQTTLQTIEEWLVTRSRVRHLGSPVMSLSPSSLPDTPETWVFEPDPASFETARIDS
jgi:L-ascorbate metabolism protein UlaG (beta-lactamase superfamily)